MELSKQAIGRAGEFQAAAIFERHGIVTTHVDVHGVDLWCETSTGRRVTIQVKASQRATSDKTHPSPRYHFNLREVANADVYCFVALDLSLLRLRSLGELPASKGIRLGAAQFTEADMLSDLKRYLY